MAVIQNYQQYVCQQRPVNQIYYKCGISYQQEKPAR